MSQPLLRSLLICCLAFLACGRAESGPDSEALPSRLESVSETVGGTLHTIIYLTGSEATGAAPLTEYFDATHSYSDEPGGWISAFRWDFGDGSPPSNAAWVAHTYTEVGTYTATLTATDHNGHEVSTSVEIKVEARQGPLAKITFTGSRPYGIAPSTQYLDATTSTARDLNTWIKSFRWDFGDGSPVSNDAWVAHTYTQPGIYKVTLTAVDNHDVEGTATADILVSCASPDNCEQPPGLTRWIQTGSGNNETIQFTSIFVDTDAVGNAVMSITFLGSRFNFGGQWLGDDVQGTRKTILAKFSPNGEQLWEKVFIPEPDPSYTPVSDGPYSVAASQLRVTPAGDIWFAGRVSGKTEFDGTFTTGNFVLHFLANGDLQRVVRVANRAPINAFDKQANHWYSVGFFQVDKIGQDGALAWSTPHPWSISPSSVGVDEQGNLILGGQHQHSDIGSKALVARMSSEGEILWSKIFGSGDNNGTRVGGITLTPDNGFVGVVSVNPMDTLTWAGTSVARFNTNENFLFAGSLDGGERWLRRAISDDVQVSIGPLAVDASGNIYTSLSRIDGNPLSVYSSAGDPLWTRSMGLTFVFDMAVHPQGLVVGGAIDSWEMERGSFFDEGQRGIAFLWDVSR